MQFFLRRHTKTLVIISPCNRIPSLLQAYQGFIKRADKMALINLEKISLAYGHKQLLDKVELSIDPKERICLVGRNGAGKSSFLKVLEGQVIPDEGRVIFDPQLKMSRLDQDVPREDHRTVYEVVTSGLGDIAGLIDGYHRVLHQMETDTSEEVMNELFKYQHELDAKEGWVIQQQVDSIISQLNLPADTPVSDLSGGWRRRTLLAKALVNDPDLLLLDEPTNHLDVEAITWLEDFLLATNITLIFITHDRSFLKRLATRIIDLDRGHLASWPGNYDNYLVKKEEALRIEAEQDALFDKRLAQEEVWIRQGIKARRTRNEGRVRRLEALRMERSARRNVQGNVSLAVSTGDKSGKLVFEAEKISFKYEDKPLVKNFSTRVMRGDRIGLIGPNGTGKTTLLQLMLGQLQPDEGIVNQGTKLEIAYFDQQREQLDPEKTVIDNVADGSDMIDVQGKEKHVISYLRDFLFDPERLRSKTKTLSGGEKNRLLLAKLFTKTANLLILDEPTNDLDVETLELLESLVMEYEGTILIVSHDRTFLDNVVTSTWVFEGDGQIDEYFGGYQDYLRQSKQLDQAPSASTPKAAGVKQSPSNKASSNKKNAKATEEKTGGLTFKEKMELEDLLVKIDELEAKQVAMTEEMALPAFYEQTKFYQNKKTKELAAIEKSLSATFERWEYLDGL